MNNHWIDLKNSSQELIEDKSSSDCRSKYYNNNNEKYEWLINLKYNIKIYRSKYF